MKSDFIRKSVRKVKKIIGLYEGMTIKSSKWIWNRAKQFEADTARILNKEIESNGDFRRAYPQQSRMIEYAINNILYTEKIRFKNMWIIKNPYMYSPLCAMALFQTKRKCKVKVTVKGKTPDCDICYTIGEATIHRVPIMGLYADYENKVEIQLLTLNGSILKIKTVSIKTEPLKGKTSQVKITNEVSRKEYLYGLTLVYGGEDGVYPYAFDRKGDIRFAFGMVPKTYGFQPVSQGRFLLLNKNVTRLTFTNTASTQLFEVDQMGRFHKAYNIEKGAHHDFAELSDGNLVMAGNCVDGHTYEDTVIELDRNTGLVLNEIRIKDYIDSKYVRTPDWAHLNTVEYNKEEKTVMVCLRNLHTVLKIDYENKKLMWILGHPAFWKNSKLSDKVLTPVGADMKWFFQAHAAYSIEPENGKKDKKYVIIFDNHTDKRHPVSYYDKDKSSSVKIYEIDGGENTVRLFYSVSFEKSNIRSNGIYEKQASRIMAMNGKLKKKTGNRKGSIIEFNYESKEVLNQYSTNFGFYRAYEFNFAANRMAKPMDLDTNYVLGKNYEMNVCEAIDTTVARELPQPVLEETYSTEEKRRESLAALCRKNPDYDVDAQQDMARISLTIEEDMAYFHLLDHQLEKLYFVGDNNTYFRDYSDTRQERPEYFARANNIDPVPLGNLENDNYVIYYKHSTGLYRSKFFIKINNSTNNKQQNKKEL